MSQNAYFESQIHTSDPVELVAMLYRGAVESLESARCYLAAGDIAGRSAAVTKAVNIVTELAESLDVASGGELARNLQELYAYILGRIQDGNFRQLDGPFVEAIQLLSTVLEGWEQITSKVEVEVGVMTDNYQPLQCTF